MGAVQSYLFERNAQQEAARIVNKPRRLGNVHTIGVWENETSYPESVVRILASKGLYCHWQLVRIQQEHQFLIVLTCDPDSDAVK